MTKKEIKKIKEVEYNMNRMKFYYESDETSKVKELHVDNCKFLETGFKWHKEGDIIDLKNKKYKVINQGIIGHDHMILVEAIKKKQENVKIN